MSKFISALLLSAVAVTIPVAVSAPAKAGGKTAGQAVAGQLPTSIFAAIETMQDPRISPDGKHIAVTLTAKGNRVYAILPLGEPNAKPMIVATAGYFKEGGDRDVFGYRWIGNNHLVLTLLSREIIFGDRADLSRLASYDLRSKKLTSVAWDEATAGAADILYADEDKAQILLERQSSRYGSELNFRPEVVRVDLTSGKVVETVVRPNPIVTGWFADGKGVVRVGTGSDPDTGKARLMYRSNARENFATISNQADKDFTGAGIQPSIFLDQPDMAIVTDNSSGFRKAYRVNMKAIKLDQPVFEIEGYDISGPVPNKARNDFMGFNYEKDRSYTEWTDPKLKQVQVFLDEEFGMGNASIVSSSKTNDFLVVAVKEASQPGGYYLYDVPTGSFRLLGWSRSQIKDGKVNPVSYMSYKASDGMAIKMVVTMPRHRTDAKKLPVVVLTHGGPYGVRDYAEFDTWAQSVAELGYVVIQPNYRGSGGYGSAFLKAGRNDGFGTRMQDDLNDAVDYLAGQGIVDPSRACMMGWSYGGYASARAAQRDPQRWKCTIAGAGVYDLQLMRDFDKGYLGTFGANYLAKGATSLAAVSPAKNASGKWSPILIVHGVRDPRVPIAQARTLVAALKSAGKTQGTDFQYIEQPLNGHYSRFFTEAEGLEWLGGVRDWLGRWNPAYIATDKDKPVPLIADAGAKPKG